MSLLNHFIARTLPFVPKGIVRRVANRYIAGETTDGALQVVEGLNSRGIRATLDILGEHVHTREQAHQAAEEYLHLLEEIAKRRVDSTISIRLTQLGLKIDSRACFDLADRLVRRAKELIPA